MSRVGDSESKEVVGRTWHSRTGGDLPARPMEVWTQQARAQNRWLHWPRFGLMKCPPYPPARTPEVTHREPSVLQVDPLVRRKTNTFCNARDP